MTLSDRIGMGAVGGILAGIGIMTSANGSIAVIMLGAIVSLVCLCVAAVLPR
jgi:hypothetical protein